MTGRAGIDTLRVAASPLRSGPVIVGIDGAGPAADAVALGRLLGELLGARLDIVTVSGRPASDTLPDAASTERAALIVLGHGHRDHLARVLHGTARRLLRHVPCPIAVAPSGFADRPATPIRLIGVGFEPTLEAVAALAVGHHLAARADGELRAIGVVLPLAPFAVDDLRDPTPYVDAERRIVSAGLERAVAELGATVRTVVDARVGSPGAELVSASSEFDLLVCGSRRRRPLRALLVGSVTERLLAEAACPVLIVPRPIDET